MSRAAFVLEFSSQDLVDADTHRFCRRQQFLGAFYISFSPANHSRTPPSMQPECRDHWRTRH
ncbi:MAG TPA: hypothetical protein VFY05_12640 [Candidatus Angelobacter sp.]|nr:hypothetical protein [Candidatus Angelobacter sp.]